MRRLAAFLCASVFLFSAFAQASRSDSGAVVLTREQATLIEKELNAMRLEASLLRKQSESWKADSEAWRKKCEALEEKLTQALQTSESSEKSVIELTEIAKALRTQLDELRKEFNELNKSFLKRKRAEAFWRATAITAAVIAAGEGVSLWLLSR